MFNGHLPLTFTLELDLHRIGLIQKWWNKMYVKGQKLYDFFKGVQGA